ncbi:hypothetical protein [Streptomyces incanus]
MGEGTADRGDPRERISQYARGRADTTRITVTLPTGQVAERRKLTDNASGYVVEAALRQPGPVAMLTSDVDGMARLCGDRVRLIGI